jgi:hypothetical protein
LHILEGIERPVILVFAARKLEDLLEEFDFSLRNQTGAAGKVKNPSPFDFVFLVSGDQVAVVLVVLVFTIRIIKVC